MNILNILQQPLSAGPVNIPLIFIPVFLAWIIYQFLIKIFYKRRYEHLKQVDRLMFNGLIIILITWKLSPVLFQFSSVIRNPLALLYLPGGLAGVVLGLGLAFVFYTVSIFRQEDNRRILVKSLCFNTGILLLLLVLFSAATVLLVNRTDEHPESSVLEAGMKAPGFILEDADGLVYQLSDYTGKILVLNFWASWCPPCRAELPELKSFNDELNSDEVVFLSVNMIQSERDPEGLPDFIKNEGLTFPVLYDKTGKAASDYNVVSIPTTVIIGRDGLVSEIRQGAVTAAWLKRMSR